MKRGGGKTAKETMKVKERTRREFRGGPGGVGSLSFFDRDLKLCPQTLFFLKKKESIKMLFKKYSQNQFLTSVFILFAKVVLSQFSEILHKFWRFFS